MPLFEHLILTIISEGGLRLQWLKVFYSTMVNKGRFGSGSSAAAFRTRTHVAIVW